ncbi:MAG: flagellar hook-length control protein FliK, partial [Pirellulales bacterium]|nr:flagellar hook-length control protein FliK [Pirellulales bacterium]
QDADSTRPTGPSGQTDTEEAAEDRDRGEDGQTDPCDPKTDPQPSRAEEDGGDRTADEPVSDDAQTEDAAAAVLANTILSQQPPQMQPAGEQAPEADDDGKIPAPTRGNPVAATKSPQAAESSPAEILLESAESGPPPAANSAEPDKAGRKIATEAAAKLGFSEGNVDANLPADIGSGENSGQQASEQDAPAEPEGKNRTRRDRADAALSGGPSELLRHPADRNDPGPSVQPRTDAAAEPKTNPSDAVAPQAADAAPVDSLPQSVATPGETGKAPQTTTSGRAADGVLPDRAGPNVASHAPTAEGKEGAETTQADRARFVQRVARAFESLGDRGGSVRLRLHPPELGSLRLEVTVRSGVMTARLEAETPAAQAMLRENLPMLRERLAEQNIRVERFDVDLMDRSGGGSAGWAESDANARNHEYRPGSRRSDPGDGRVEPGAGRRATTYYTDAGRFDATI